MQIHVFVSLFEEMEQSIKTNRYSYTSPLQKHATEYYMGRAKLLQTAVCSKCLLFLLKF